MEEETKEINTHNTKKMKKLITKLTTSIIIFGLFIQTTTAQTNNALIPTNQHIKYVKSLPKGNWEKILADIIKLVLQITGSLALISFTVGGIMMITAQGGDNLTKGKMVILWSIIALTIIAISYAIITGITQLQFFT